MTSPTPAPPDPQGANDVRRRIRADLPAAVFAPRPRRALWFVPLLATVAAAMTTLIVVRPAWYWSLALSLVIGQCFASMGFLAHEALHGALVRPAWLQTLLGYLGFGPVGVSPHLWRVWHNQVHHGHTNQGNADPDGFGTLRRYERAPSTRFVARLAPGSGHWASWFFLGYWFTFHGQVVLWIQSRYMRSFARLNRRRAKLDTFAAAACWAVLAVLAGRQVVFVMVVPVVVGNAIVMSYIATNHFLRPQTRVDDPVANSMSVDVPRWVDRLHFNFSHHVEHHLFPRMSAASAPAVRAWLLEHEGDRYVSPPQWLALALLYGTPRVYLDRTTLCDPEDPSRRVSTDELADVLTAAR